MGGGGRERGRRKESSKQSGALPLVWLSLTFLCSICLSGQTRVSRDVSRLPCDKNTWIGLHKVPSCSLLPDVKSTAETAASNAKGQQQVSSEGQLPGLYKETHITICNTVQGNLRPHPIHSHDVTMIYHCTVSLKG